jgi:hypothetical protein
MWFGARAATWAVFLAAPGIDPGLLPCGAIAGQRSGIGSPTEVFFHAFPKHPHPSVHSTSNLRNGTWRPRLPVARLKGNRPRVFVIARLALIVLFGAIIMARHLRLRSLAGDFAFAVVHRR